MLTLEADGKAFDALAGGRLLRARLAGRASFAGDDASEYVQRRRRLLRAIDRDRTRRANDGNGSELRVE